MKKISLLFLLMISMVFWSCDLFKTDDDEEQSTTIQIEDASWVSGNLPSASGSLEIEDIIGNPSVLPGGSNVISIKPSTTNISYVNVGIQGEDGYYQIPAEVVNGVILIYVLIDSELTIGSSYVILVCITDGQGNVSAISQISVNVIEGGTGKLQVSCSWNQANDVDLHLIEPNSTRVYWSNKTSTNGGHLDVDSNASCNIDNINNENITYDDEALVEAGEYEVQVDLYDNCSVTEATSYVVTARIDGNLVSTSTGSNPYYGTFTASSENDDYKTVMKFNIASNKSAMIPKAVFSYPQGLKSAVMENSLEKYPKHLK